MTVFLWKDTYPNFQREETQMYNKCGAITRKYKN